MEIRNPRRILCVGPPDSGVLTLLKELTGSAPEPHIVPPSSLSNVSSPSPIEPPVLSHVVSTAPATLIAPTQHPHPSPPQTTTTAGTSHTLPLITPYYTAHIPIWLDEAPNPLTWSADFLTDEAAEVVKAVGAWIIIIRRDVIFASPSRDRDKRKGGQGYTRGTALEMMKAIKEVIERAFESEGGLEGWDGVLLMVSIPDTSVISQTFSADSVEEEERRKEEWEDLCAEVGVEWVDVKYVGVEARKRGTTKKEGVGDGEVAEEERDEFGEVHGIARVRQALEACEWEDMGLPSGDDGDVDDLAWLDDEDDAGMPPMRNVTTKHRADPGEEEDAGFHRECIGMQREFLDLKLDLAGHDDELTPTHDLASDELKHDELKSNENTTTDRPSERQHQEGHANNEDGVAGEKNDVESLDALLRKLLAVKEMSGHLSEAERKRMARRVVGEVMGGEGVWDMDK